MTKTSPLQAWGNQANLATIQLANTYPQVSGLTMKGNEMPLKLPRIWHTPTASR